MADTEKKPQTVTVTVELKFDEMSEVPDLIEVLRQVREVVGGRTCNVSIESWSKY